MRKEDPALPGVSAMTTPRSTFRASELAGQLLEIQISRLHPKPIQSVCQVCLVVCIFKSFLSGSDVTMAEVIPKPMCGNSELDALLMTVSVQVPTRH
jgi:hypothetical protein